MAYSLLYTMHSVAAGIRHGQQRSDATAAAPEPLLARLWWLFLIVSIHGMWGIYPAVARWAATLLVVLPLSRAERCSGAGHPYWHHARVRRPTRMRQPLNIVP